MNIKLEKTIVYILRHNPNKYNLHLDDEGYVFINDLILGLKNDGFNNINIDDIFNIVNNFKDKKRFKLSTDNKKICALYGHSKNIDNIIKISEIPPDILYHGTNKKSLILIKKDGLKSMNRQYVHYSIDIETAIIVGKRRTNEPIILKINSKLAYENGIQFYSGNDGTWLSKDLPLEFIEFN